MEGKSVKRSGKKAAKATKRMQSQKGGVLPLVMAGFTLARVGYLAYRGVQVARGIKAAGTVGRAVGAATWAPGHIANGYYAAEAIQHFSSQGEAPNENEPEQPTTQQVLGQLRR